MDNSALLNCRHNGSITRVPLKVNKPDISYHVEKSVDKLGKTRKFSTGKTGLVDGVGENSGSYPQVFPVAAPWAAGSWFPARRAQKVFAPSGRDRRARRARPPPWAAHRPAQGCDGSPPEGSGARPLTGAETGGSGGGARHPAGGRATGEGQRGGGKTPPREP